MTRNSLSFSAFGPILNPNSRTFLQKVRESEMTMNYCRNGRSIFDHKPTWRKLIITCVIKFKKKYRVLECVTIMTTKISINVNKKLFKRKRSRFTGICLSEWQNGVTGGPQKKVSSSTDFVSLRVWHVFVLLHQYFYISLGKFHLITETLESCQK